MTPAKAYGPSWASAGRSGRTAEKRRPMSLVGKTALVTGAGRGIGRAIALALARQGAQVAALDVDGPAADRVRGEIDALGVKALALCVDLTRRAEVERAVESM